MLVLKMGNGSAMMRGIKRIGGRTVVCVMVILAGLLLVAASRWIAGAHWPQMLADLVQ